MYVLECNISPSTNCKYSSWWICILYLFSFAFVMMMALHWVIFCKCIGGCIICVYNCVVLCVSMYNRLFLFFKKKKISRIFFTWNWFHEIFFQRWVWDFLGLGNAILDGTLSSQGLVGKDDDVIDEFLKTSDFTEKTCCSDLLMLTLRGCATTCCTTGLLSQSSEDFT